MKKPIKTTKDIVDKRISNLEKRVAALVDSVKTLNAMMLNRVDDIARLRKGMPHINFEDRDG